MLQLAGDPRLAEEALSGRRVGRVTLGQQLDGDIAVEGGVAGTINDAHAAVADLVDQLGARRTGGRGGRFRGGGLYRSGGGCQVVGHGIPVPSSPAVACGWSRPLNFGLNMPGSRLDFPRKRRIAGGPLYQDQAWHLFQREPENDERVSGGDGDVLSAVHRERHGIGVNVATRLELPETLARLRVESEEVAF